MLYETYKIIIIIYNPRCNAVVLLLSYYITLVRGKGFHVQ